MAAAICAVLILLAAVLGALLGASGFWSTALIACLLACVAALRPGHGATACLCGWPTTPFCRCQRTPLIGHSTEGSFAGIWGVRQLCT